MQKQDFIVTSAFAMISALGLSGAALGADMPVKARPPQPVAAPVYNWTGAYVGLNAGGVWADTDINYHASDFGFSGPAGAAALNAIASGKIESSGFTAGGQIGYNHQFDRAVLGIEADLQYTDLSGSRFVSWLVPPALGGPVTDTFSQTMQSKWLGTVRGRLGFASGPLLFYATGGLAVADVSYSDVSFFPTLPSTNAASKSEVRAGWTVGGGAEWLFSPNWSVKAEYLYVDLGTTSYTSVNNVLNAPPLLATIGHDHHLTENIARVGINYKFGGAAVVAKY
jgi:outer membrane immunogenic protein